MKKATKMMLSIAVALIIVGGGLSVTALLLSGGDIGVTWNPDGGFVHLSNQGGSGRFQRDTLEVDAFTDIAVNVSYGDVELLPSDGGWQVEYAVPNSRRAPEVTVEDGVLRVDNSESIHGGGWLSNMNILGLSGWDLLGNSYYRIYYPADAVLEEVTVTGNMGELSAEGVTVSGALELHAGMGDISMEQVSAQTMTVHASMGEIACDGLTGDFLEVTANMGDITVNGALGGLTAKADMGDVDLSGALTGKLTVENSMGDVDVALQLPRNQVFLDLDTHMGDVRVNGKEYRTGDAGDANADTVLTVSASMGDVAVAVKDN